jgi:aldose 1-epimerase
VSICTGLGNNAFEMRVNGCDLLWLPCDSLDDLRVNGHGRGGIPFLGPWANRLDEQAFYANGRRFGFDMTIGNIHGATPIHGLLMRTDQWQTRDLQADDSGCSATSRLEFFRDPHWMRQFPFPHAIEMTHRLRNGALTVTTRIENAGEAPMPVAIGFHPYFRLSDSRRDEWTIGIGARTRWLLSESKLPTGEVEPIERSLPNPCAAPLRDHDLDDVFSDLVRDTAGHAVMSMWGRRQRLDIEIGPKYRAAVVYAPKTAPGGASHGEFVCLEPMAGITNAMNLAHRGMYDDLQYIAPGATWEESFSIVPSGF